MVVELGQAEPLAKQVEAQAKQPQLAPHRSHFESIPRQGQGSSLMLLGSIGCKQQQLELRFQLVERLSLTYQRCQGHLHLSIELSCEQLVVHHIDQYFIVSLHLWLGSSFKYFYQISLVSLLSWLVCHHQAQETLRREMPPYFPWSFYFFPFDHLCLCRS